VLLTWRCTQWIPSAAAARERTTYWFLAWVLADSWLVELCANMRRRVIPLLEMDFQNLSYSNIYSTIPASACCRLAQDLKGFLKKWMSGRLWRWSFRVVLQVKNYPFPWSFPISNMSRYVFVQGMIWSNWKLWTKVIWRHVLHLRSFAKHPPHFAFPSEQPSTRLQ